jgi:predicted TIM-barrel fold metal-dependent hydrolase
VIVDSLVIAGPNRFRPGHELDDVIAAAGAIGVEGLVAAPGRPSGYHLGPANDHLADAARAASLPIARLGRVDPLCGPDASAEARRCLDELGCTGLFLHPGEEAYPVREAAPVMDVAAERGVPVVVAAGLYALSEPLQMMDLALAYPTVPIVMTSGGQINISGLGMVDAWLALQKAPNLHVTTNGEYRQDFIERLARDLDPTRVLYCSFSPYFDMAYERSRVANAHLGGAARSLVEGDNACRMFHLQPATTR